MVSLTMVFKVCVAVVALVLGVVVATPGLGYPRATRPPKKYTVSLDLPEEDRWTQVVQDNREVVQYVHSVLKKFIPEEAIPLLERVVADIDKYLEEPYADEMRGIANALNMSLGDVVGLNLVYDATAHCTSIVSQDENGQIWHSRNLDYSYGDMLRNITIAIDFKQGGKIAYSAVTYAGYIGILSGQRPNMFTVTVDERDQGSVLYNLLVALLDRSVVPMSFLVRDSLAYSDNFESAIKRLANTPTAGPVYFIIGGAQPGDGAVISKGRLQADDIWRLEADTGRWYLVETNYDHWLPPPAKDDRRDPAIKAMNAMTQPKIGVSTLFDVMSTPPVLNSDTTYTVIMSAAQPDIMQTWIRLR